jgi:Arc/MetJ-type ribon-helix-helix transcriptional regulator
MKERASFTFDRETLEIIDKLVDSRKYRNKSHVVEDAIRVLEKKLKEVENERES